MFRQLSTVSVFVLLAIPTAALAQEQEPVQTQPTSVQEQAVDEPQHEATSTPANVPAQPAVTSPAPTVPAVAPVIEPTTEQQHLDANFGTRSRLAAEGTFVSYSGKDYYGGFKADYTYHFYKFIRGVHFGVGGILGKGKVTTSTWNDTKYEYDATSKVEDIRFYHALAGIELEPFKYFSMTFSGLLGVCNDGEEDGFAGGFRYKFRVGPNEGVNLQVGSQLTSHVGHYVFLAMQVPITEYFRITPRITVENLPSADEPGVLLSLKGEYRFTRNFGISLEGGVGAHDTKRVGFNGTMGLAAYF
ncbi:MAG: hypothetical protein V1754_00920 [Pseudomonadota bacterium]